MDIYHKTLATAVGKQMYLRNAPNILPIVTIDAEDNINELDKKYEHLVINKCVYSLMKFRMA